MNHRELKEFEQPSIPEFIKNRAEQLKPEMLKIYKDIHENPELGGEEFETSKKIINFLKADNVEILAEAVGGTGVIAIVRGEEDGPTIALRADIDALPIEENKDHEPRSKKEGVMHACGHDLHTSGLLGAAKIIKEISDKRQLHGNILFIFQPSEEKAYQKESGAIKIIKYLQKSGLRDKIDAFFGIHITDTLQRGEMTTKEGVFLPSSGEIDITLECPGGSIVNAYSTPNLDTVFSELTVRLNNIFKPGEREGRALVATAGPEKGIQAYNVLLEQQKKTWVVRIFSEDFKKDSNEICAIIKKEVKEVVEKHLAELVPNAQINIEVKKRPGYRPVVHRDAQLVAVAKESGQEVLDNYSFSKSEKIFAGEDFSFYLENLKNNQINGVYVEIGAANDKKEIAAGRLHTSKMKVDTEVVKDLSSLHAQFAVNAINYFNKIKEKHES